MEADADKWVHVSPSSSRQSAIRRFVLESGARLSDTANMRRTPFVVTAILGLTLGFSHPPVADASEVVKLARLVITGKRLSPERLEPVAMRRNEPATTTAQTAPSSHVAPTHTAAVSPATSGQDTQARNIATPSRGVLSFF